MKRFVIAWAGSVALAAGAVLAPTTGAAGAGVSAAAGPAAAIAVEGSNGQLYVQAPQLASGWHSLGGRILAAPAVAAQTPQGSAPANPLFIATGAGGRLYLRSLTAGWQPAGPASVLCQGGPAAVITGSTLTVACEGTNRALYDNTATVPGSGLPQFTSAWKDLGGVLTAGPAVAPVGGAMDFFAPGLKGRVYTRTASTGYTAMPWTCSGQVAAAQQAATGTTTFACQGAGHALWEATSTGAGWTRAVSLGGQLIGGPGIAAASSQVEFFAEGTNRAVYQRTATSGWASIGGVATGGAAAVALSTAASASWGNAIEIPGLAALGTDDAQTVSISCPSAGNCTVGGFYQDSSGSSQAFVADEVNGTWGDAIEVPGTAALNTAGGAEVFSVSCASAGNCAAVGNYEENPGSISQPFVADEVNGTWGDAIEVPGIAALNTGNNAILFSVSCPSPGNCTAGGSYSTSSAIITQAFVADEVNGTWGDAIEVPGTAALNTGSAQVGSVSCASAGNCAAAGFYASAQSDSGIIHSEVFVADEVNGSWGDAIEVPGTAALDTKGVASVSSVSCPSAGNCGIGGSYTDSSGHTQAFVDDEVNGTWDDAIEVPGTAALNTGGSASVGDAGSVSCPSAGNCTVGGYFSVSISGGTALSPFVVSEVNGTWDDAIQVPGTAASAGGPALVTSVSCSSMGNCVAGGAYNNSAGNSVAFVVSEVDGTWGEAITVPGTPSGSQFGGAEVFAVSCPPAGGCAAGGEYSDLTSAGIVAFVVNQS